MHHHLKAEGYSTEKRQKSASTFDTKAGMTYGKGRVAIGIVIRNGKEYGLEILSIMNFPFSILIMNYIPGGYQGPRYHQWLVRAR